MCEAQVHIGQVTVSCTYRGINSNHEHRGTVTAPASGMEKDVALVDVMWGTP